MTSINPPAHPLPHWLALAADQPERREALDRIGKLYGIERTITGKTKKQRQAARDAKSRPLTTKFKTWLEAQLEKLPQKSDLTKGKRRPRRLPDMASQDGTPSPCSWMIRP